MENEKKSEEYFDMADSLRNNLPTVNGQVCTVFSTLSKRNESRENIGLHIKLIREGRILL
jgi:hypothetical protein